MWRALRDISRIHDSQGAFADQIVSGLSEKKNMETKRCLKIKRARRRGVAVYTRLGKGSPAAAIRSKPMRL
jgi:hypothetical protein